MADHFIGIQRGERGLVYSDFIHGTAASATSDIEIRIKDSANWNRREIIAALEAFERFIETGPWMTCAGLRLKE